MTQPTEKVALTLFYNSPFFLTGVAPIIQNRRRREMYKVQNLPDACEAVGDVQADL